MDIGHQIMWIEQNMPANHRISISTNNNHDGLDEDYKWFVLFCEVIDSCGRGEFCMSREIYKGYNDDLSELLCEVISNIKRIVKQN